MHAGAVSYIKASFGQGVGPIQLDDVQCIGNENRLLDCPHRTTNNCGHSEDAGVGCNGESIINSETGFISLHALSIMCLPIILLYPS